MLAVESERDIFGLVNLIQNPVGVVLHGSCENHDFVELTHLLEEDVHAWSDEEVTFVADLEELGIIKILRSSEQGSRPNRERGYRYLLTCSRGASGRELQPREEARNLQ